MPNKCDNCIRLEALVHHLRETLKTAKCYIRDGCEKEEIERAIQAANECRMGPPSVHEGDYLMVGRERWRLNRDGGKSTLSMKTPRRGDVFRVDADELIAAGVRVLRLDGQVIPMSQDTESQ